MEKRKIALYVISLIGLIVVLLVGGFLVDILKGRMYSSDTSLGQVGYYTVLTLTYICVGMIFGVHHLYVEKKKKGRWRVNVLKLLIMGTPFLTIIGFTIIAAVFGIPIPLYIYKFAMFGLAHSGFTPIICRMALGFILVTSFYKREIVEVKDERQTNQEEQMGTAPPSE